MDAYQQFLALTDRGNFIPVFREFVADLDTPVGAWYRVCQGSAYNFLLESVEGGERIGRYSLLGCDPLWRLANYGDRTVQVYRDGSKRELQGNPFHHLAACLADIHPVHLLQLPPSIAGVVGFWGYELIKWIEPRVPIHPPCGLPDGLWMQFDRLLVFDQVKRKIWVIVYADTRETAPAIAYDRALERLEETIAKLHQPLTDRYDLVLTPDAPAIAYESNFTETAFTAAVEKAKEYIRRGDIFQVVLSQRLSTPFSGDPFRLYRALRLINPSPYMAYLQFGDWQLIGSSPEVMVKVENTSQENCKKVALVRPIAGTRKRGATPEEDQALAQELLQDPKEIAEHVMLVDLGRNDLGRVCRAGTVKVNEMMTIERYSHVMHIVSNVVGEVLPSKTAWDVLQATFPAGTVSGAPKIRAMEIIYELEPDRRGPYAGAYGYYDFRGQLNVAITIRSLIVHQGRVSVQAGAGIVADSQPHLEYQETLNKARGMLEAIRQISSAV
ncbi:MAG: anthranilate synthase component I [Pseudanabaenaceae cyanobacterium SKYGB_i_bin29]|nr:anthranilate synthase component I [Pseudanabaenaceae cyanobacterium SKYG29]MDW8421529.1 anthranilate synthase component I [Pseudanabaenaceae cyanobacterium SKYGB_i_bin29]